MSDPLLSPDDVRRGLEALVDELVERGASTHIRVVGGAAVMIQAGRKSLSRDIDALYSPSSNIDEAIRSVAMTQHWPNTWLNVAVKMYASNYDDDEDWEIHITRAGVTVSVATCKLLLATKLLVDIFRSQHRCCSCPHGAGAVHRARRCRRGLVFQPRRGDPWASRLAHVNGPRAEGRGLMAEG